MKREPLFDWEKMPLDNVPRFDVHAWQRMPIISTPPFYWAAIGVSDYGERFRDLAGYQWPTSIEPSQLAAVTWLDEATA